MQTLNKHYVHHYSYCSRGPPQYTGIRYTGTFLFRSILVMSISCGLVTQARIWGKW